MLVQAELPLGCRASTYSSEQRLKRCEHAFETSLLVAGLTVMHSSSVGSRPARKPPGKAGQRHAAAPPAWGLAGAPDGAAAFIACILSGCCLTAYCGTWTERSS